MEQYHTHTISNIQSFLDQSTGQFEAIFARLTFPEKDRFRPMLVYVDNLINTLQQHPAGQLQYLHLHFPYLEPDQTPLLEFLCIKFYLSRVNAHTPETKGTPYINELLVKIDRELSRPIELSPQAKKRELGKKTTYRSDLRKLKTALAQLQDLHFNLNGHQYMPKCLINILTKDRKALQETGLPSPFFMCVDDFEATDLLRPVSYVLLNDKLDRDELDTLQVNEYKDILEHIEHVILFNSDSRSVNKQFNIADIKKLNAEGLNIKALIVLSFDQKLPRLERLMAQLTNISANFYEKTTTPNTSSYTIMPFEIDALLQRKPTTYPLIEFLGEEDLHWQYFQERIGEHESLYELISIKMRNLYALCASESYKKIILDDIFLPGQKPRLLSEETKEALLHLSEEYRHKLRDLLTGIMDIVQKLQLFTKARQYITPGKSCIVLPYTLFNCPDLITQVKNRLGPDFRKTTFVKWKDIDPGYTGNVIILEYRDPGRYPFQLYPNIFEFALSEAESINAIFPAMFFQHNHDYAKFEYSRTLCQKVLHHPVRTTHFKWNELIENIKRERFDNATAYLWDFDNNYANAADRDQVLITFATGAKRSFYPTELFVAKYKDSDRLFSLKAEDIAGEEIAPKSLYIQPLDDLYEGLNLFVTTNEEESEIKELKQGFDLTPQDPENSMWKILLRRKAGELGANEVYAQLKVDLSRLGLPFIKETYFAEEWLDPESEFLIPRSKKVFKVVCNYIGLPEVYFRVMLKKRASERLASRKSTAQMNRLIARLVEMGLFNDERPACDFDEDFLEKYDLEDIGFNRSMVTTELYALADLCKSNLQLKEVLTAEIKQL
jgi:hypothetical protein